MPSEVQDFWEDGELLNEIHIVMHNRPHEQFVQAVLEWVLKLCPSNGPSQIPLDHSRQQEVVEALLDTVEREEVASIFQIPNNMEDHFGGYIYEVWGVGHDGM